MIGEDHRDWMDYMELLLLSAITFMIAIDLFLK
jgi:hypothetical protein